MAKIVWDQIGARRYETGIDRGVLYLPDNRGVAWNGLVSIQEGGAGEVESFYYDGRKYLDFASADEYYATLSAITYPDEFMPFDGLGEMSSGLFIDDQNVDTFNFSYRTKIGDDVTGSDRGYKIHIVYNATAAPTDKVRGTLGESPDALIFAWNISAKPEPIDGYKPTAHVILDTTLLDPYFVEDIEDWLYGSTINDPRLPSLAVMADFAEKWGLITIFDNEDGTWTARGRADRITMLDDHTFKITSVEVTYLDANTYTVSTTHV